MRVIKKGSTDQSVVIRIVDSADGTPETGVEHNSSGIDLWYRREGATKTSITEAALTALNDAHSDGGIEHIGDGYYRLDLPDAAFATGSNGVAVGGTVTGMVVIGCYVHLVDYDAQDTVRLGLTALPNAAADAAGGLIISDAGGLDADAQRSDVAAILTDTGTTGVPLSTVISPGGSAALRSVIWDATAVDYVNDTASTGAHLYRGGYTARHNTAQAGGATSITLDASASSTNDIYNNHLVVIRTGTGSGQARFITDYDGTTKVATVGVAWQTNPDNTSVFFLVPLDAIAASAPTAAAIADAVWDEAQADHVAAGSFGITASEIADILTDTSTTLQGELDGIQADTEDIQSKIGTPAGASLAADIAAIEAQTDDIGVAGAGLTAIPWNAAWDAEVESEVDDALGGGTGTALTAIPWNAAWDAEVESEVDDALGGGTGTSLTAIPWNASWDAEVQSEVTDALEVTLSDSIPADGTLPSVKQALYMITQFLLERSVSSTTVTVKKADGTTSLFTLTLNDATTPTSITRAS